MNPGTGSQKTFESAIAPQAGAITGAPVAAAVAWPAARWKANLEVRASSVCARLIQLPNSAKLSGRVLSLHSQAVYLWLESREDLGEVKPAKGPEEDGGCATFAEIPGNLICLAPHAAGNMPGGVLLGADQWGKLLLNPGEKFCLGAGGLVFAESGLVLRLDLAALWGGGELPRGLPPERLASLREAIAASLNRASGALGHSLDLENRLAAVACGAADALQRGRCAEADQKLLGLLGLGFGLTPSGDDYCLGLLAAIYFCNPSGFAAVIRGLSQFRAALASGATTPVSSWLLLHALSAHFPERISALAWAAVNAEINSGESELSRACQNLAAVGASSGRDILRGLLIGLDARAF